MKPEALADSLDKLLAVIQVLEGDGRYLNLNPKGEPQLGKRGLYSNIGGSMDSKQFEMALLWVLNYSDGENTLLEIADRGNLPFTVVRKAADALLKAKLLEEYQEQSGAELDEDVLKPISKSRGRGKKRGGGASPLEHASSVDFWDDFIDGDPDLSNASLANYFKEEM